MLDYLEQKPTSPSVKRTSAGAEMEPPAAKRMLSLARMEEIRTENDRLKNQVEKFTKEWMRTKTIFTIFSLKVGNICFVS